MVLKFGGERAPVFLIFIFLKSCDYLVRSGNKGPSSPIENVENKVHSGY